MTKIFKPLFSFKAFGTIAKTLSLRRSPSCTIAEKKPLPFNPNSPGQKSWRHMYQKCIALWNTLSVSEKANWELLATPLHMTGFAYWQSQCLKPNPGIYLPLQCGIMQGNIDMDGYRIQNLPIPLSDGEPLTQAFYLSYIAPYLYHEGASVTRDAVQLIPKTTATAVIFTVQRYDTDTMHSTVLNPYRLTIKTAGKYVITSNMSFESSLVGERQMWFSKNDTDMIAYKHANPCDLGLWVRDLTTIWNFAVNDFVACYLWHNSNLDLDLLVGAEYSPNLIIQRIGN